MLALILLNLALLLSSAAEGSGSKPASPNHPQGARPLVFEGNDRSFQLVATSEWAKTETAAEAALLCLANARQDLMVYVFAEAKPAPDHQYADLGRYSELLRSLLVQDVPDAHQTKPTRLTVGGLPAIQSQVDGTFDGNRLTLLHTVVETETTFYQIRAVSAASEFPAARQQFDEITSSFQLRTAETQ